VRPQQVQPVLGAQIAKEFLMFVDDFAGLDAHPQL
jgi:hypothetical protein